LASKFSKPLIHWLLIHLLIPSVYVIHRLLSMTLRVEHVGAGKSLYEGMADGKRCVCAFLHCDDLAMAILMRQIYKRNLGRVFLMVSRSRDGDLMAAFLSRAGGVAVRGSSSRGGARALLEMVHAMGPDDNAAIAVDGPRGPRLQVKMGVLTLASLTNRPVLPVVIRLSHKWTARSWDRMEFPLPFSRMTVYYGAPVTIPPDANTGTLEALRMQVENELREMKGEGDGK
jgi:lysophospholipid acyltransferase (LPLAT)-like uncharacterized protein